jgi:hypothetical protein
MVLMSFRGLLSVTELDAYVDASVASDVDMGRSTAGYVLKISGGTIRKFAKLQMGILIVFVCDYKTN